MAENINIAGRFHSTATGNVVAGANEIYDDTKGKKQSVVNQETDAALDDRYTKSQTYNKTELNNMITTPNQKYVTVKATDQTTAATDVLPATGSADTVYRVGNWDGSQFDETVFSEYSWNGSTYIHLNTKTQIGEVFDISAYHATGGTLAKYADLAAALDSNNGGGVPQSLQKGGMSVKFVRTDNMYVQCRLMSQEFTTDTTKWQGVSDELARGSKDLVENGTVYEAMQVGDEEVIDLTQIAQENSNIAYYAQGGYYYWQSNDDSKKGKFIPVLSGKKYRIIANNSYTSTYALLIHNSHNDGALVKFADGCTRENLINGNETVITCPSDAAYLWIKTLNGGNDYTPSQISLYDKKNYQEVISGMQSEIDDVSAEIDGREGTETQLDISSATEYEIWISYDKWSNTGSFVGRKMKMINVPSGYENLKIIEPALDVPDQSKTSKLAFLKSATAPVNNAYVDFCVGETSVRDVSVGENVYEIPSDCVAIAIGTYLPSNVDKDVTPSSVSVLIDETVGLKEKVAENTSDIEELQKKESGNFYGYTISKFETEKMAHVSNIDFANGYFYIPYTANERNKVEAYWDMYAFNRLAVVSLCNLSQPKWYDVAHASQTIGDITIQGDLTAPYTPTIKIKGDYAYVIFRACVNNEVTFLCRRFVLATQEFEDSLTVLTLDGDPFTTSKILSTYNSLSGANVPSLESRGGDCNGSIILADDGYYYTATGARGVNYYGLIYRSQDLLNWESVAAQNLNLGTYGADEINVVQIESNKLLVSQRDSTKGIILRTYDITNDVWSNYLIIPNSLASRPWGFVYNGDCYVAVNVNGTNVTIPGYGTAIRQNLAIYKVDTSLNIELIKTLHRDCSMQYPAFIVANENKLWMSFTTDTRHLDAAQGKSDIELKELYL